MIGVQSAAKNIKKEQLTISSWFLLLSAAVLPFDSYLGEMGLSVLTLGLQMLFIASRFVECLSYPDDKKFFSLGIVGIYVIYSLLQIFRGFLRLGLTYNNELFISMMCYYIAFIFRPMTMRELRMMANISILQMLLFVVVCARHITLLNGEIYMGIVDIVDPNYLITNSVVMVGFYLLRIQSAGKNAERALLIALLVVFAACVMLVGSRGGLFTFGVLVIVYVLTQMRKPWKTLLILIVVGGIAMGLFFAFAPEYITERFSISHMLQDGGSGRLTIWKNFLTYYGKQDLATWLFGVGRDVPPTIYLQEFGRTYYPHNLYVKTLMEGGIVGIALLLAVFWHIWKKAYKAKNGMLIAIICAFMFGSLFLDMDNMRVFWLILALCNMPVGKTKLQIWKRNISIETVEYGGVK